MKTLNITTLGLTMVLTLLFIAPMDATANNIFSASKLGNILKVKEFISKGADVNARDRFMGSTPLIYAAAYGWDKVAEFLISKGANVNAQDDYGLSALMVASANGHIGTMKLLISNGADVNAKDKTGKTALMFVMVRGHTQLAQYLQSKGAKE